MAIPDCMAAKKEFTIALATAAWTLMQAALYASMQNIFFVG